jgi:hypothetical protein
MITLFNGDVYEKKEIISLMEDDSFYFGNLNNNALSQSSLKTILRNPYDYLKQLKGKTTK